MQNLRSKLFISFRFFVLTRVGVRHSSPRLYFFYDHTGAIGKAFACIDLLRARTHTARRECRSNFTPFVEGSSLSRESN